MKRNKMLTMLMLGMTASALLFTGCEMPGIGGSDKTAEEGKEEEDEGSGDAMVTVITHQYTAVFEGYDITSNGSYQEIVLSEEAAEKYPELAKEIDEFNKEMEEQETTEVKTFAYNSPDSYSSYEDSRTVEIVRFDDKLFSFVLTDTYSFDGGDQFYPMITCYNFDVKSGDKREFSNLVDDREEMTELIYESLLDTYPDKKDDFSSLASELYDYEAEPDEDPIALSSIKLDVESNTLPCYVDKDGFKVKYIDYSFGDGAYDVTVSLDDCKDILNEKYSEDKSGDLEDMVVYADEPAETIELEGELQVEEYDPEDEYDESYHGDWGYENDINGSVWSDLEAKQKTVTVSTAEELMNAIASDTCIILKPGKYDITDYVYFVEYGQENYPDNEYLGVASYDMDQIGVLHAHNLTIKGEGKPGDTEIVVDDPMMDVLPFYGCSGITIENITFGHDVEAGSCTGEVLAFAQTGGVRLRNLDLYGCGTYAINALGCYGFMTDDCVLRDCEYGAVVLGWCENFDFTNCKFERNGHPDYGVAIEIYNPSHMTFTSCSFQDNKGEFFTADDLNTIAFDKCTFGDMEQSYIDKYSDYVTVTE
ncbi:MAG: right-handed parallel beta-helix repeat-containing protein [Lachnospiraceae bacterium]|nr:right-handed parallel beta-helix repeat-containing protein [Lachnospiraceae bacterium]